MNTLCGTPLGKGQQQLTAGWWQGTALPSIVAPPTAAPCSHLPPALPQMPGFSLALSEVVSDLWLLDPDAVR